jgi:uncharacterized protein (UPF0335 family)
MSETALKQAIHDKLISAGFEKVPGSANTFTAPEGFGEKTSPGDEDMPAEEGHNANASDDRLRLLVERIERLEEEKKGIADDIKDVYAEGKAVGYDAKIMREIVKLRKMPPADRREREQLLETYLCALGMDYAETPLGKATISRAMSDIENSKTPMAISGGGAEYKNKAARELAH